MGNKKISEKKRKEYLISIISAYLTTNLTLMNYYKALAPDTKSKRVCTKSIKSTQQAIQYLYEIKHIDILEYIYSCLVGNNAVFYSVSPKLILNPKIKEWDTDEHHQEFVDEIEEQRIYEQKKEQERIESQKAIENAIKQGKKVEMVYDKDKKKVVPLIVEDTNA